MLAHFNAFRVTFHKAIDAFFDEIDRAVGIHRAPRTREPVKPTYPPSEVDRAAAQRLLRLDEPE